MAINLNSEPYFDDFDESKGFYKILFKPGYAVQARELTQLQTQIQDQIKKFGNHIFREGSVVVGGERFFEDDLISIKIGSNLYGNTLSAQEFEGKIATGQTSGTQAVIKTITLDTESGGYVIIAKLISGSSFTAGEEIQTAINSTIYSSNIIETDPFANAMMFSINSGVFFVNGNFVYNNNQSVVIDAFSNTSSKNIGFLVDEVIVTAEDDESLLDNSQGSSNYAAPGADRYSINLTLSVKDLEESIDNFVEIARVIGGKLVVNLEKTIYSEIGNELARRTFDESGDYTVKKWPIQLLEHESDDSKFVVALGRGKGYVKGYEFETINETYIEVDKARQFETANEANVNVTYGNYVNVSDISGVFNTTTLETVTLKKTGDVTNGTAKVRYLQYLSGDVGTSGAIYRMYLFDIVMDPNEKFEEVLTITSTTGSATIDALSKVGGTGETFLSGTDSPGLVFPFANDYIKTVRNNFGSSESNYQFQRTITSVGFSAGSATISTSTGLERFVGGSGALSDTVKDQYYHVVVTAQGTSAFDVGTVLRFNSGAGRSITLSVPVEGSTQNATFDVGAAVSFTATIIATIDANAQTERVKSLSNYTKKVITADINTVIGDRDSLEVSDIYDIVGVYNIVNNDGSTVTVNGTTGEITWNGVTYTDVTSDYILDNGQRAEFYDHGSLILVSNPPTATDNLLIVYRNFSHTGSGFLSVDSYSIAYDDIPSFTDPSTGRTYQLRDCIDFRPRRQDGSTSLIGAQLPNPLGTFDTDYQYYLARMDRIIAMPNQTFQVKSGVPAINPVLPINDTNGMPIYDLLVLPYTTSVQDIAISYVDNKRYTMRDIGKLEKRIGNLEYYTQLSLLEKQAKDTSIPDSSNLEKFKNGFAVDPFTSQDIFAGNASNWASRRWGWWNAWFNGSNNWNSVSAQNYNENSLAQPSNIDFNAAIDPVNQELRAPFTVDYYQFDVGTLSSTVHQGDLVSLSFSEVTAINQPLATTSVNVNPFDVIKFFGSIDLNPTFDNWIDTVSLPAVNKIVDIKVPDLPDTVIKQVVNPTNKGQFKKEISRSSETISKTIGSTTTNLGTSIVDVQYVPFIRQSTVFAIGKLFKPKTRLYPFFDNTAISQYVKPLTLVTVENHTGTLFSDQQGSYEQLSFRTGGPTGSIVGTARTAIYTSPLENVNTQRLLTIFNESGTISAGQTVTGSRGGYATVVSVETYNLNDPIITSEYGSIGVQFDVPANKFRTGERVFRLIDNNTNDTTIQESIGEATYTATGILQTKQATILTTRSIQNQKVTTVKVKRYDPTAQTFDVDALTYPEGLHVSSVEVYFRTKSANVPVTVELRRTVNGYPESVRTIPFGESTLFPEDVNISENGSAATKFIFPSPIHLTPGEYSIVVLANTSDYNIFVAETGQNLIGTNTKVDKQPYIGSLFVSQNAGTWTADQTKDMKFKVNRADFATTGTITFNIQDPEAIKDYQTLFANCSVIAPPKTSIAWEAKAYNASSVFDSDFSPINVNQDIDYQVLKQLQEASSIGAPALTLRATLRTESSAVSPVIDAATLSVAAALNNINNDSTGEDSTQGGNAIAKYITKPVELADGFDASNLCVTIDINKPSGTDVEVYYKALPSGSTNPISNEVWNKMDLESSVQNSVNVFDYSEHRYFPSGAFDEYGIPVDNPIINRFNVFQVKIVMLSNNQALTPKIRDLRIIALDS